LAAAALKPTLAAAREVMHKEAPRKILFHLNNEATYDTPIWAAPSKIFIDPSFATHCLFIRRRPRSTAVAKQAQAVGFGAG